MNQKEKSLNQSIYSQISKKGLVENDKKLLIKKFGFNNLSYSNLNLEKITTNKNSSIYTNSLSSLKIEIKKPFKISNNNNNFSSFQTLNISKNNRNLKNTNSLSKNSSKNKKMNRNNKSMAALPISSKININEISNYSLNKIKKIFHNNVKNNNLSSINTTTGQNSIKTNQYTNSNKDLGISPNLKTITKNKNDKIVDSKSNNKSSQNLINIKEIKESAIKSKHKPYKILNNNLYNNYKNEIEAKNKISKYIIESPEKNKSINKNNISKKEKNNTEINIVNINQKIFSSLDKVNKENKSQEIKKHITRSNEYSDETKKESCLDLQKLYNENVLNNASTNDIINGIISNNMNLNDNKYKRNKDININQEITLNEDNNNINNENSHFNKIEENEEFKYVSTQKISLNKEDSKMRKEINDIIKRDSNFTNEKFNNLINSNIQYLNEDINIYDCDEDEKINYNHNDDNKIDKNFFDFNNNENNFKNNSEYQNDQEDNSSLKTHKNIYKKLCELNNMQEMSKEEEKEIIGEQENKSGQTQTTVDKNNLISKYIKQPIYNISPRFLINETSLNNKHIFPDKPFIFIKDIENENIKFPSLDLKKFLNLNEKGIYKLISFTYDNYNSIISINKLVKNKINNSLKNIFQNSIDDFKLKYKDFLSVIDYSFNQKTFVLNHKKNHLFNLEIKCKVITKEVKQSYEIGCNYISLNKKYDYIWKFDVQKKEDIKVWICTEVDIINNLYKKFSYTSQVTSFCYNDEISLQFNIFNKGTIIEPKSIEWIEPIKSEAPIGIYEKTKFISPIEFDQLRACEIETQILFWKNKLPEDDGGIVEEFKKIFGKFFKIKNIQFDESKFYFYKFEMKANKIGLLKQNKFSTFDINIIDNNSNIQNEIQCIYLINSNYYTKKMDIRVGNDIIIYLVDMKR